MNVLSEVKQGKSFVSINVNMQLYLGRGKAC